MQSQRNKLSNVKYAIIETTSFVNFGKIVRQMLKKQPSTTTLIRWLPIKKNHTWLKVATNKEL